MRNRADASQEIMTLKTEIKLLPRHTLMRHLMPGILRAHDAGATLMELVDALQDTPFRCSPTMMSVHLYTARRNRKRLDARTQGRTV